MVEVVDHLLVEVVLLEEEALEVVAMVVVENLMVQVDSMVVEQPQLHLEVVEMLENNMVQ